MWLGVIQIVAGLAIIAGIAILDFPVVAYVVPAWLLWDGLGRIEIAYRLNLKVLDPTPPFEGQPWPKPKSHWPACLKIFAAALVVVFAGLALFGDRYRVFDSDLQLLDTWTGDRYRLEVRP